MNFGVFRWLVTQAKELGPAPTGASDGLGDLRQAPIGPAVPGKAIGEYSDPLHTAVPFASQHRARSHLRGLPFDLDRAFAGVFRRAGCIEQPLTFGIKVTQ